MMAEITKPERTSKVSWAAAREPEQGEADPAFREARIMRQSRPNLIRAPARRRFQSLPEAAGLKHPLHGGLQRPRPDERPAR